MTNFREDNDENDLIDKAALLSENKEQQQEEQVEMVEVTGEAAPVEAEPILASEAVAGSDVAQEPEGETIVDSQVVQEPEQATVEAQEVVQKPEQETVAAQEAVLEQEQEPEALESPEVIQEPAQTVERELAATFEEEAQGEKSAPIENRQSQKRKEKKQTGGKSFLQSLLAGVIGSILTLLVVFYLPLADNNSEPTSKDEPIKPVETEQINHDIAVNATGDSEALVDMVEDASKAIVGVVNYGQQNNPFNYGESEDGKRGTGSGVIFKVDGDSAYVVTNNHVIEDATRVEISLANGEVTEAELIGTDALTDIAVLKISAEHVEAILSFGDSDALRAGEQVIAIGNPLGLDFSRTVTQGIISGIDRTMNVKTSAGSWDLGVIQTDAAINPGNSGGALLNTKGQVIGINSLKIAQNGVEGLGFAIPSNDVLPLVNQLIQNGKVERPYVGISMVDLEQVPRAYLKDLPNSVINGVVIASVDPASAAGIAGIEEKDILVSLNGKEIESSSDLRKYLYTDLNVGDTIPVEVYRGKELITLELKLTANTQGE